MTSKEKAQDLRREAARAYDAERYGVARLHNDLAADWERQAYREEEAQHDFGWALTLIKEGRRVRRQRWKEEGRYVYLLEGTENGVLPGVAMHSQEGEQPGWTAGPDDLLAEDWQEAG